MLFNFTGTPTQPREDSHLSTHWRTHIQRHFSGCKRNGSLCPGSLSRASVLGKTLHFNGTTSCHLPLIWTRNYKMLVHIMPLLRYFSYTVLKKARHLRTSSLVGMRHESSFPSLKEPHWIPINLSLHILHFNCLDSKATYHIVCQIAYYLLLYKL